MPHIDQSAKTWEMELSGRIGVAVQARRKALKLTAQQLAERTRELGYLVTRVAISKIETNNRAGKFDVAELIVLAVALEIPPMLLLFPNYPDGVVEALPAREVYARHAADWFGGKAVLPDKKMDGAMVVDGGNDAIEFVKTVERRRELELRSFTFQLLDRVPLEGGRPASSGRSASNQAKFEEILESARAEVDTFNEQIATAKASIWGTPDSGAEDDDD
jgi:transcriptional regulator with XRE-family HTH domain